MTKTATRPRSAAQLANDERLRSGRSPAIHVPKGGISTRDAESGQQENISISTSGKAEATSSGIEAIDARHMKDKAEQERFMNEPVTIFVESDDDPNSPVFLSCGHNGIDQYVQRGVEQTIKRRFLYSLLAAKRKQFACSFGKDGSGQEYNRLEGRSRPTHSLQIVRDDNPRGREWFNAVMREQ